MRGAVEIVEVHMYDIMGFELPRDQCLDLKEVYRECEARVEARD